MMSLVLNNFGKISNLLIYSNKLILLDREAVEQLIQYMRDNDVRIVSGEYKIPQTSTYEEIVHILVFESFKY